MLRRRDKRRQDVGDRRRPRCEPPLQRPSRQQEIRLPRSSSEDDECVDDPELVFDVAFRDRIAEYEKLVGSDPVLYEIGATASRESSSG